MVWSVISELGLGTDGAASAGTSSALVSFAPSPGRGMCISLITELRFVRCLAVQVTC